MISKDNKRIVTWPSVGTKICKSDLTFGQVLDSIKLFSGRLEWGGGKTINTYYVCIFSTSLKLYINVFRDPLLMVLYNKCYSTMTQMIVTKKAYISAFIVTSLEYGRLHDYILHPG